MTPASGGVLGVAEVAALCEATTAPSRKIDIAIGLAVGGFYVAEPRYPGAQPMYGYVDGDGNHVEPGNGSPDRLIPYYTGSLDAAYRLAPNGWFLRVEPRFYSDDQQVRWRSYAIKPDWTRWSPHDDWFEVIGEDEAILAATPALAICAAALRSAAEAARAGEGK